MDRNATKVLPKMSLDEARSVIWPFNEVKGQPIGSLLDKGVLSLRDMGFAVQRAYDKRVREAARTILLNALSEAQVAPEDSPGPLNVVSTERRSYAERRQLDLMMRIGLVGGLILTPLPYLAWRFFHATSHPDKEHSLSNATSSTAAIIGTLIGLIIIIAAGLAVMYVINKILNRVMLKWFEEPMKRYRKGQLGEERVLNVMYSVLDGRWWLFRNLELPGRRIGDLDLVLVGPCGMWNFEVKAYSGEYRNVGEHWEKRSNSKWYSVRKSPTRQAKRNAAELGQLLSTHQIKQWVTPVIIWANPESTVVPDNPSASVWTLDQLSGCLKDLSGERPVPEGQVEKIVDVLKKICQDADAEISD